MARLRYLHYSDDLDPGTCISVDGTAPGRLNLSHWPGNRTPDRFRHDVSTGMCIKLAEAADRAKLLEGISTVTNNHWDTDGVCSVFACLEPGLAIAHAPALIAAAAAGDFAAFTTPEGVKIDLTIAALTKRPDSPVASEKFNDELERRQAQYNFALEMLPRLLAKPDMHADWFAQEFWSIQQDLRALREEDAEMSVYHSLDLAIVTTDKPLHETAVNTATGCDRILTVVTGEGLHHYELRLTTLSWFQLQTRQYKPRLLWSDLAGRLAVEAPGDGEWRAEDVTDPTPRLAFLNEEGELAANATRPEVVRQIVAEFFTRSPHLPAGI